MTATALDQADRRPHRRSPRVGPGCHLVANSWPASEPRGACWREAERRRVRGSPAALPAPPAAVHQGEARSADQLAALRRRRVAEERFADLGRDRVVAPLDPRAQELAPG